MNEAIQTHFVVCSVLLCSFKRDGTPVQPPVSIAVDGDHVFFRSYDMAWKAKRLRNNPNVEVAPSTLRGSVTGPTIPARAKLLTDGEANAAAKALAHQHRILQGVLVPITHRLMGSHTTHYELTARDG